MFKNNPQFFINFLFFQHTVFVFEKLCFAENIIKIVLSEKHSFSKTQLVKPTSSPMSKNTFFKEKVSFLVLGNFRWNHYFYSFSWFALFWSKQKFWPKQIVCTKMRVFSLPDTNSVRQVLLKSIFWVFHIFGWPPPKKPIFIGVLGFFHFDCSIFLFLFFQHKKDKNKKCDLLSKTSFLTSPKFCKQKTLFWHNVTLFAFSKYPPNTIKMGKTMKTLDQFLFLNLDQFLTLKPPNFGPILNFTACIDIERLAHK